MAKGVDAYAQTACLKAGGYTIAFSGEIIITSTGKGSGALITAQYGEKYHRKIWIITNDRKSSV